MDIILIAGLWLDESVWDDTTHKLAARGHRPRAVVLPGTRPDSTNVTLDDQIAAVLEAVDAAERPLVVGHSAACGLAWIVADRRPESISGVVLMGGMPVTEGAPYFDGLPLVEGALPFPGWEPFEGRDIDDLDARDRAWLEARMHTVPGGVVSSIVRYTDPRRFEVPVTMLCTEFSPGEARAWVAAGMIPELASVHDLRYVDIDSGHWPMASAPESLAHELDRITRS